MFPSFKQNWCCLDNVVVADSGGATIQSLYLSKSIEPSLWKQIYVLHSKPLLKLKIGLLAAGLN